MAKKPDLTVPSLVRWLKRKKPTGEYDYLNHTDCLLCQFVKSQGFKTVKATGYTLTVGRTEYDLDTAMQNIPVTGEYTFGAALERAQKALAS